MINYTHIPYFIGIKTCLIFPMGYWVSSEQEHFLEGMFIMEKYEFFLFPTVYSLFSKTALISIYCAGLIQPPI
jgi:hypothetical protein